MYVTQKQLEQTIPLLLIKLLFHFSQSLIRHLYIKDTLHNAIDVKRLHHQLLPMQILYENGFDPKILNGLQAKGHITVETAVQRGFSAVTGISKVQNILEVSPDSRRNGSIAVY